MEVCENDIIEIESNLKKPLLDYLSKHFNIKTETIYNDIQGFIRNQHNHSTAEVEFYRGNANAASGDHGEAIVSYDKAIDLNIQFAEAYYNRGIANTNLENHEKAIKDYNKAIELNPQYVDAYSNRGVANFNLDKHEEAIKDYNKAIEIASQFDIAYYNRGNAKLALGYRNGTIKDYKEAIEDYTKAKTLFAKAENMEMVKKCEDAIARLQKLIMPQ